jgi:drug/metabolite transporter (DMT)-like permease
MPDAGREARPQRRLGLALAVGGLLLLSLESPGLRLAGAGAWESTFAIGAFSALSMALWVRLRQGQWLWAVARASSRAIYVSALLQAACAVLFVVALQHTRVANTVVILAASPAIGAVIARLAIREQTSLRTWIGIAGSMLGLAIVFGGSLGRGGLLGDLAALGAVVAFAANLTLLRRFPELSCEVTIGLSGVVMAAVGLAAGHLTRLDARAWLFLAGLGLLTGPFGRVFIAASTRHLPVAQVGLLSPVETIAATLLAWWWLGEAPLPAALIGGLVVSVALVFGLSG